MKLSMTTFGLDACYSEEQAIQILAESGFDAIDLSLIGCSDGSHPYNGPEALERAKKIRALGETLGITFNQTHSLYPVYKYAEEVFNRTMFERMARSIEVTAELGAKHIVVHPFSTPCGSEWDMNVDFFERLTPYIRGTGVKVALENTPAFEPPRKKKTITIMGGQLVTGEESFPRKAFRRVGSLSSNLKELLEVLDKDCFAACLDVGHCGLVYEEPEVAIRTLGDRLECLHIHDNDGYSDLHTIPYDRIGSVDWDGVLTALREISYKGDFTFETCNFALNFPKELHKEALCLLEKTGRYMMSRLV